MSDRCYVTITVRTDDVKAFEEHGFLFESGNPVTTDMFQEEAVVVEERFPEGLPFTGHHGDGCSYGPADFASDGTTFEYRETNYDGNLFVEMDESGDKPDPEDLKRLQGFNEHWKRVNELINKDDRDPEYICPDCRGTLEDENVTDPDDPRQLLECRKCQGCGAQFWNPDTLPPTPRTYSDITKT